MHRHSLAWVTIFGVMALLFLRLPPMVARQDAMFNSYRALVEVDALARQRFVAPINDDRLVHGAIRGMMRRLDPYSGYIAPHELEAFYHRNAGDYIGIGVEVGMRDGRLTVISPVHDSPAARAGIRAGDVILAVDGREVTDVSVFDVSEMLSGPDGSTVNLRVLQLGAPAPRDVSIQRGAVSIKTVRGFRRGAGSGWGYLIDEESRIAYMRLSNFHENTERDFDAALRRCLRENATGLILDLRFNPGGLMEQAVAVADRFLTEGLIISTVTRRLAIRTYHAQPRGTLKDLPLIVLINAGSASSSEIVAGALQDHGRAVVVGERSFGKGSVQHLIELESQDAAIKLTTAYYRLPSGRIIHRDVLDGPDGEWGVRPDVLVETTDEEDALIQAARHELDNGKHGDRYSTADNEAGAVAIDKPPIHELPIDRQLAAAISILRNDTTAAK